MEEFSAHASIMSSSVLTPAHGYSPNGSRLLEERGNGTPQAWLHNSARATSRAALQFLLPGARDPCSTAKPGPVLAVITPSATDAASLDRSTHGNGSTRSRPAHGRGRAAPLDVAVQRSLGQVRRGHEDRLVVGHDRLGMQHAAGPSSSSAARVVEDRRPRRSRPIAFPRTDPRICRTSSSAAVVSPRLRWMFSSRVTRSSGFASIRRARTSNALRARRSRHRCSPRPSAPPSRAAPRRPAACRGHGDRAPRDPTTRDPVAAYARSASATVRSHAAAAGPEIPKSLQLEHRRTMSSPLVPHPQHRPQRAA